MTKRAPIALFAFNRPEHVTRVLRALADNDLAAESELTIFCDGPRNDGDLQATSQVREIARRATGFKHVNVVERDRNLGLAKSVISGVTEILDNHDRIIVLEDDLITSPYFLRFMNEGLDLYRDDDRVLSLCGYTFPVGRPLPETFFVRGAFCWGWATWKRGWALYEHDAKRALEQIVERGLMYDFDFQGSDPLTLILQATVLADSRADSWATRWMATACIHGKYTLYPGKSLIANIGFDGSGRHANHEMRYETPMADTYPRPGTVPVAIDPDVIAAHRALFLSWRTARSPKRKLYYQVTSLLPQSIQRHLYNALVRRWLRQSELAGRSLMQA